MSHAVLLISANLVLHSPKRKVLRCSFNEALQLRYTEAISVAAKTKSPH